MLSLRDHNNTQIKIQRCSAVLFKLQEALRERKINPFIAMKKAEIELNKLTTKKGTDFFKGNTLNETGALKIPASGPTYNQLEKAMWKGIITPFEFIDLVKIHGLTKNAQLLDPYGNPIESEKVLEEVSVQQEPITWQKLRQQPSKEKEYVTDIAPGPMGQWPIRPEERPLKGWEKFWQWLGNVAEVWPKSSLSIKFKKVSLNLKRQKIAQITYTSELLWKMLKGIEGQVERESVNFTASGAEAVVNFPTPSGEPQRYHITVAPLDIFMRDTVWGEEGPPPGMTNLPYASKLNLRKTAGTYLTPKGQELFEQASISNPRTGDIQWPEWIQAEISPDVLEMLELVANNPGKTVQDLRRYAKEFGREISESLQTAISQGYLTLTESLIASKLNLRKTAGWQITEKGREAKNDREWRRQNQTLTQFLNLISMYPNMTIEQALGNYNQLMQQSKPTFIDPVDKMTSDARQAAQEAVTLGLVTYTEPELEQDTFDLPENLSHKETPPEEWDWGTFKPAVRLNLRKKAVTRYVIQLIFESDMQDYYRQEYANQKYMTEQALEMGQEDPFAKDLEPKSPGLHWSEFPVEEVSLSSDLPKLDTVLHTLRENGLNSSYFTPAKGYNEALVHIVASREPAQIRTQYETIENVLRDIGVMDYSIRVFNYAGEAQGVENTAWEDVTGKILSGEYDQIQLPQNLPEGIASKLNLRKIADYVSGDKIPPEQVNEIISDPTAPLMWQTAAKVLMAMRAVGGSLTSDQMERLLMDLTTNPADALAWMKVNNIIFATSNQGRENWQNTFDLPRNLPEGMASRLNLHKQGELTPQEQEWIIEQWDKSFPNTPFPTQIPKDSTQAIWLAHYPQVFKKLQQSSSKLNLKKRAGWYLTPEGKQFLSNMESGEDPISIHDIDHPQYNLTWFLYALQNNPGATLDPLAQQWFAVPDAAKRFREGAQEASVLGLVKIEDPFSIDLMREEEWDLPANLPEGIANKLNLHKQALDIGGITFPDFTKEMIDAQSYIADRIWYWLNERHDLPIFTADDYYTYQTSPDNVAFNMDNEEVLDMFHDAFLEWLHYDAPGDIKMDEEMQGKLYASIINRFREGYA